MQLESYRAVASESEAKRARAEEELVTTARLAAALEAQLVAAQARVEELQLELAVGAFFVYFLFSSPSQTKLRVV